MNELKTFKLQVMLTPTMQEQFYQKAAEDGIPRADIVRSLIEHYLNCDSSAVHTLDSVRKRVAALEKKLANYEGEL